jgi:hypothetical protein
VAGLACDIHLLFHVGIGIPIPHEALLGMAIYAGQACLLMMYIWAKLEIESSPREPALVGFPIFKWRPVTFRLKASQIRNPCSGRAIVAFEAILVGNAGGQLRMKERLRAQILARHRKF